MLISPTIYRQLREILVKHYNLTEVKGLCTLLGIPSGSVVVPGRSIDEVADGLIDYCRRHGFEESLVSNIIKDREGLPLVDRLKELILSQENSFVFISCTPDLINDTDKHLNLMQNPWAKFSYESVNGPVTGETVAYYGSLRSEMNECTAFVGLIGEEMGDDIAEHHRSRFEVEYECAFFRGLPVYLLILNTAADDDLRRRINRMRGLQAFNHHQKRTVNYRNAVDLFVGFQNRVDFFVGFQK